MRHSRDNLLCHLPVTTVEGVYCTLVCAVLHHYGPPHFAPYCVICVPLYQTVNVYHCVPGVPLCSMFHHMHHYVPCALCRRSTVTPAEEESVYPGTFMCSILYHYVTIVHHYVLCTWYHQKQHYVPCAMHIEHCDSC